MQRLQAPRHTLSSPAAERARNLAGGSEPQPKPQQEWLWEGRVGVWHRGASSQPKPAHHQAGFPGSQHTGGHQKSTPRSNLGLRQAGPLSWEGSRAAAPTSHSEHPPCTHTSRPALPPTVGARDRSSAHLPLSTCLCPDVSPSFPFLSGGFPSAAPRGTVTGTVSQATPPTRSQPHLSGACFVIPFSDSSFFTCHPVLLLLISQLPPTWLWSSPS